MRSSSCKAKGRRCATETKEMILGAFPELGDDDVMVTSSGVTGEDIVLSPKAAKLLPFTFENKNVEKLNIWEAWRQAQGHAMKTNRMGRTPLLVFKRNRQEPLVALRFIDFLALYGVRLEINRTPATTDSGASK